MKDSHFRIWVNRIWQDHKTEVLRNSGKPCAYVPGVYFGKYKYWLKRQFKFESLGK